MERLGWQVEKKAFAMKVLGGISIFSGFFMRWFIPGKQKGLIYRDYIKELH